jgi:copper chaperone
MEGSSDSHPDAGLSLVASVPGMTCGHCEAAVKEELGKVPGVTGVHVDLASKLVTVVGTADRPAVAAAIDEAGFEASFAGA